MKDLVDAEVVRRCPAGHPLVVRCHPVRRDRTPPEPFPTLYWLVCDAVAAQLARLESAGGVRRAEEAMAADADLRSRVHADHQAYAAERWALLDDAERAALAAAGRAEALRDRGIGGIANRDAVKCLHLHYAHHLARGSAIGALVDAWTDVRLCAAPPG